MISALRDKPSDSNENPAPAPDEEARERAERWIRCRACDAPLARPEDAFDPPGGGDAFVNPFGYLHEVLAVRAARNVLPAGPLVAAFSWFPGYAWQVAHCAGCAEHVGWRYWGAEADPPEFFGLRRATIAEG